MTIDNGYKKGHVVNCKTRNSMRLYKLQRTGVAAVTGVQTNCLYDEDGHSHIVCDMSTSASD